MSRLVRLLALLIVLSLGLPAFAAQPVSHEAPDVTCLPPEVPVAYACVNVQASDPQNFALVSAYASGYVPLGPSFVVFLIVRRIGVENFRRHEVHAYFSPYIAFVPGFGAIWPDVLAAAQQSRFLGTRTTSIEVSASQYPVRATVRFEEKASDASCTDRVTAFGYGPTGSLPTQDHQIACPATLPDLP